MSASQHSHPHNTIWHSPRVYGTVVQPGSALKNYGAVFIGGNHSDLDKSVFSPIDIGYQKVYTSIANASMLSNGSYTVNSNGNPFMGQNDSSSYIVNELSGDSGCIANKSSSSLNSDRNDRENNNTSGHGRMELNIAPKLEPPPPSSKGQRSPRSPRDITSPDSNGNESNMSTTNSSNSLSEKRSSRDSSKMSAIDERILLELINNNNAALAHARDGKELNTAPRLNKDFEKDVENLTNENLKNLNLNLKSLKSPHKRHSSTSAELYGTRDTPTPDIKMAMQSASESRLIKINVIDNKKVINSKS
jgi:hypothetical protein